MNQGDWVQLNDTGASGKVLEVEKLWGETVCRVWLLESDTVVRIPAARLKPLDGASGVLSEKIAYVAAAARVAEALTQDVLLAPLGSSVIPLPHQVGALSRAVAGERVRYLLADEVGLGKTVEAGLIMRELKLRGLVKRTLVIAPKGLVSQWVAEMRLHFGEILQLMLPEDIRTLNRLLPTEGQASPWQRLSQVVVPMDAVKPLDKRRGWSAEQVGEYNRERFEDLVSASWDLVIVDEAHRLGGSTDQVARFRLGQGLAEAAPYLLLLSATPHQGKTDAFHRLLSLLDAKEFPDAESVTRDKIQPYVIRTEKRRAVDAEGKPLFRPRRTQLIPVAWETRHRHQQALYHAVTEYVRQGYNQALREKKSYIGFLMILMQRLVVSSTAAIRTALAKRLDALDTPEEQSSQVVPLAADEWAELDGQEQLNVLLQTELTARKNERAEVELLLLAAARCAADAPDAKAEALLDLIYRLQSEEADANLKVLVFTEFVPTQEMLRRFLAERGFVVVCLNGSMSMEERRRVQETFAKEARLLISTDAGGEGLNLQFCHVVINYDMPWNPMRLEQRIGRVDRIGQAHVVRAVNLVLEGSVEHRVREVLEQKLAVILEEFGIDKTGDVLDSAQAGQMFDEMYREAILAPEKLDQAVAGVVTRIDEQVRESQAALSVFSSADDLDASEAQRLLTHPLPHWVEQMTISYIRAQGGQAKRENQTWHLTWPDGCTYENVVFCGREAQRRAAAKHLTLDDSRVQKLVMQLPSLPPGQPIPVVTVPGLSGEVTGYWSLWQISLRSGTDAAAGFRRIMPLFLADNGLVFLPTAKYVWDQLLATTLEVTSLQNPRAAQAALARLNSKAQEHGRPIYEALKEAHFARLARERQKAAYAFAARQKSILRVGLPQVRAYRLNLLAQEEHEHAAELAQMAHVYPELAPLLILRVGGS